MVSRNYQLTISDNGTTYFNDTLAEPIDHPDAKTVCLLMKTALKQAYEKAIEYCDSQIR